MLICVRLAETPVFQAGDEHVFLSGRDRWGQPTLYADLLDNILIMCYTVLMNETLIRTISIKLDIGDHEEVVQETQKAFNAAASWIASLCWDERITNTNTAHHRVYRETRTRFGLGSQLEQ